MGAFNKPAPFRLSSPLLRALGAVSGRQSAVPAERLSKAVADLSRLFTVDRGARPAGYLDRPDYAAAYLAYFLPVNVAKVQVLLDELPDVTWQKDRDRPLSVLDLGMGPGTGALAFLDWAHQTGQTAGRSIEVVGVDRSQRALQDAARLWQAYVDENQLVRMRFCPVHADLARSVKGLLPRALEGAAPFDLVILANCLNELRGEAGESQAEEARLAAWALSLVKPTGALMIVEPALRETSRRLHALRDRLLEVRLCTVYSPCLHDETCPALIHPDDWCHEDRTWVPPEIVQAIDQEVGFIKDALKFSYLLLRKDGLSIAQRQPDVYRVVSELRAMKGETRAWLCNQTGRSEAGRLDRFVSTSNAAFSDVHRGAIVRIDRLVRKEGRERTVGRIPRDAMVEILRPV